MENNNVIMDEVRPRKWLLVILIIVALVIVVVLANKVITDRKNKIKQEEEKMEEIFDNFTDGFENIIDESDEVKDQISQSDIDRFNFDFEFYTGTKSGNAVSMLLDKVLTNNKKQSDHIITVTYGNIVTTDENGIISIKKQLDVFTDYEVLADYDENGYIMQIRIMN